MSNAAALAKLQEAEKELVQLEAVYAELSTDLTLTAASMAPPPAGTVADVVSIGCSLWKGDWGGALMDAVGIIPIVGDGIKGVTKGTKIASRMKDVKRALQAARTKINSKKRALTTDLDQVRKNTEKACKNKTIQKCSNMGGGKDVKNDGDSGKITIENQGARLGERRVSQEVYDDLRASTPNSAIRDKVNKGKIAPYPDEALPGLTVSKKLEADHIVPMDTITRMEGFDKLSKKQQLSILNNQDNFIGLSRSANASKGSKSFEEWTVHKKTGIPVDPDFRKKMIVVEKDLKVKLQQQIDGLAKFKQF